MREFDQPRFCDLSLIIMITMRRGRRNLIDIIINHHHELCESYDESHLVVTGLKRDLQGRILHQVLGSRSLESG